MCVCVHRHKEWLGITTLAYKLNFLKQEILAARKVHTHTHTTQAAPHALLSDYIILRLLSTDLKSDPCVCVCVCSCVPFVRSARSVRSR